MPLFYLANFKKILSLDINVYTKMGKNSLFFNAFINVFVTGLTFGLANLYYTRIRLQEELSAGFENPTAGILVFSLLVIASIAQIFLAHAGFSLLLWAISKGFNGKAQFFAVYQFTGVAFVPLWIGVPFIFLYSYNILSPLSLILGVLAIAWAFATVTRSIMACQSFKLPKAAAALALTIIFIISFRSLMS